MTSGLLTPYLSAIARSRRARRDAEPLCQSDDDLEDRRVAVHVLVRVEVGQTDTCRVERFDLRFQLLLHLRQRDLALQAGDDERPPRRVEPSIVRDQGGHAIRREHRRAIDER